MKFQFRERESGFWSSSEPFNPSFATKASSAEGGADLSEMKSKNPELLERIRNSGEDVLGFFAGLITRKESAKNKSLQGKGQKERL